MLKRLKALWTGERIDAPEVRTERPLVAMQWQQDVSWPIPDWDVLAAGQPEDGTDTDGDQYWTTAAHQWLECMAAECGRPYAVRESTRFLLLSPFSRRESEIFLGFCESARGRLLRMLDGIAAGDSAGKHVVIVFSEQDDYYDYVSNYYAPGGEYAMSSGMFIQAGYGHFVLWQRDVDGMEPVIAHELAHCLVAHLPLPAWLNEGIAVNSEYRMFPHLAHPHAQQYSPAEMAIKHAAFWNPQTIQEFWSGKSFLRADDGNLLSYDLATKITALAARDLEAFKQFACHADGASAGGNAQDHLGYPLEHLVEAVLGEGAWQPMPEAWDEGVERGQFHPFA